ncbi:fatty acid hydroxylase family protein [Hwanghaeella grinnelliae]|uniref:Fatty acid hydroxylase family protein n=1 Tax=Hwanghaeella grinnelliae TaxID=2500179 RepID=A0A437QYS1_9PROT|nr:sterol desaturase family protein [Hwanghaeella grinnelliae]RVU39665.1 fatty acid hydroxylase family protein [Hwanghaeella grinnelliae]
MGFQGQAGMEDLTRALFGPGVRLFPVYLLATVIIAFAIYQATKPGKPFLKWLLPREVWRHPSTLLDVKLFAVTRGLFFLGIFNQFAVTNAASILVVSALLGRAESGDPANPLLVGFFALLVNDFGVYWVHRLHHDCTSLWPFHAVHHSAEVMTPITTYRKHPVYDLISSVVRGAFYGVLQGTVIAVFFGPMAATTIVGINLFYFVFNLLGSNLRHSHIWLSYGRVLDHILISPAQHQIHHSRAPRHHNKNYGEVLAIWDWIFGTLYVPKQAEALEFGLADPSGRPLPQPHNSLKEALVEPLEQFAEPLRGHFLSVRKK